MDVLKMNKKGTLSGAALGVIATVLAASGGYLAHANAQAVGPARNAPTTSANDAGAARTARAPTCANSSSNGRSNPTGATCRR